MKDFFKNVLATAVGVLLVGFITGFFMVVSLVGMALSQSETAPVADNSVLVLRLTGSLSERANDDVLASLFGDRIPKLGLATMTEAIRQAKESDKVKGIYIEAGAFAPDSYASLAAIRRELEEFRKAGKWIIAYGDSYTQGAYYLASVADKVYLNPQGQVDWHGLGSEPVFVKDLLAKLNVRMQVAKVGTYKSATEMFTGEKMSDADRQQTTAYLTGIWQNVVSAVGKSRSLTAQQLNAYADSLVSLAVPRTMCGCGWWMGCSIRTRYARR